MMKSIILIKCYFTATRNAALNFVKPTINFKKAALGSNITIASQKSTNIIFVRKKQPDHYLSLPAPVSPC